ncbi:RNA-binding protein PNO1 [Orchesella cincta]|uniref:RNA-binding protein PNO1 n=1 Tax=Orchesella cincta TaxID=48709 RepID=A0A1D2N4R8_ORCCI|nr:RNA-binding protein PNO1 [Orchesella cincta]
MEVEAKMDVSTSEVNRRGKKRSHSFSAGDNKMDVEGGGPTEKIGKWEMRKVPIPSHRYTPLKQKWKDIFTPIVEHLELQVRFNLKTRNVEIRAGEDVKDSSYLQKAVDFVQAFVYGFAVEDALALIRLENLFIDTFEVQDVKPLKGDHLSRAIGRLAGKGGRTKFTIENATKTRIVLADSRIHILGSYENIQLAKRAVCNLILGTPPLEGFGTLRSMASGLPINLTFCFECIILYIYYVMSE